MIWIEKTDVFGWEAAIRGMRNPMNSWDKSDSEFSCKNCDGCYYEREATEESIYNALEDQETVTRWCNHSAVKLGKNDLDLMKRLSVSGSDHGKFLRMITVSVDLTAPLYWWKEFDTYKVGTVANSCSTMHKIHAKEFELDDFSHEHMTSKSKDAMRNMINVLNLYREQYNRLKNKRDWMQMIQLLPSSYNQLRTVTLNYEVLKRIYYARRNHKLDEWHTLCDWIKELPYFKEIVLED